MGISAVSFQVGYSRPDAAQRSHGDQLTWGSNDGSDCRMRTRDPHDDPQTERRRLTSREIEIIGLLYQVPKSLTRQRFTNQLGSDSTWRTKEVRHVGFATIAPGF
jgi:hypothetical protein